MRNPVFVVSDQGRPKPLCTNAEEDYRLVISDLGKRGIVTDFCTSESKGAGQLRCVSKTYRYRAADLRLCFRTCITRFLMKRFILRIFVEDIVFVEDK